MKMKRLLLLLLLSLPFFDAVAQIEVESFRALPNDMTAKSLKGTKHDQNGKVCALIKIVTTEKGFIFDGGSLGIVETAQKPGEIWVWVPPLSRKITISHEEFGVLRDYDYDNYDIESGCTYELVLRTPKSKPAPAPQVTKAQHKCTLIVSSDKAGDMVFLNDSVVGCTPMSIAVKPGQYEVKLKRGEREELQSIVVDDEPYKQLEFKFVKKKAVVYKKKRWGVKIGYAPETFVTGVTGNTSSTNYQGFFAGITYNVGIVKDINIAAGAQFRMNTKNGKLDYYNYKNTQILIDVPVLFNYGIAINRDITVMPFVGPMLSFALAGNSKMTDFATNTYTFDWYSGFHNYSRFNLYAVFGVDLKFNQFNLFGGYRLGLLDLESSVNATYKTKGIFVGLGMNF